MVYHVLPEAETFSEHYGGAISRWAANVLRGDNAAQIVCARSDGTWGFDSQRARPLVRLDWYARGLAAGRGRLSWRVRMSLCAIVFAPLKDFVQSGDVVYIHNRPEFVPVLRALLRKKSPRIVLHLHNSHLVTYPCSVATRATADLTLFCSRFLENEARQKLPNLTPTAVIPNGADGSLFYPRKAGETPFGSATPVVLFVGRFVPEKGAHIFVAALKILQQRGIDVRGRLIGSPDFGRDGDTAYTRELHAAAPTNVDFVAYASGAALATEFRQAAIFCCPSVWNEAFGMVNVEAMASGLPVVATQVGGIPEIFSDGGAILVAPDSATALADALAELAGGPAMRARLGADGYRAFCARFDWRIIRQRYDHLIAPC